MPYLLDTHSLSVRAFRDSHNHEDWFVLRDVFDEFATTPEKDAQFKRSNIKILETGAKHLHQLIELLEEYGDNLALIRLLTNEGKGDVMLLAYIIAERDHPDTLFPDIYTLITRDEELTRVAKEKGIVCLEEMS